MPTQFRAFPQLWPPVGYPPLAPGDVFEPWRDQNRKGLEGLFQYFRREGTFGGGDPNAPGCKEEWEAARRDCAELVTKQSVKGPAGGYRTIEDCARGLVSEECGGNEYKRPKPPRKKRYRLDGVVEDLD
jgi:hypothetical protein